MSMVGEGSVRSLGHLEPATWVTKTGEIGVNHSVDRAPTIISVDERKQCTQYSSQVLNVDGTLTILTKCGRDIDHTKCGQDIDHTKCGQSQYKCNH